MPEIDSFTDLQNLVDRHPWIFRSIGALVVLIGAVVAVRLVNRSISKLYWRRRGVLSTDEPIPLRLQREQTMISLLQSGVRYGVFGAGLLIAIGLLFDGVPSAIFGASLAVVVVGFGLQRIVGDFIAGMLLIFEGQYAIGDTVTLHPQGLTGVVEEFSLRATVLRHANGDRSVVLNGSVQAFTRLAQLSEGPSTAK